MQRATFCKVRTITAVLFCLLLSACAPAMYQQPATNFQKATDAAQTVYFSQLDSAHQSFVFWREMNFNLDVILDDQFTFNSPGYLKEKKEISEQKKSTPILKKSLEVRRYAFQSLDYYAQVLIDLASDKNVDSLTTEIKGFASDLKTLSTEISNLSEISASLKFLGPVSDWAGPLGSVAGALNTVIQIVTDYLREKAIRTAIVKAAPMVRELLTILQEEVGDAVDFQRQNYQIAMGGCTKAINKIKHEVPAARYLVHEICFNAELKLSQVPQKNDVAEVMKLVKNTHAELEKMAQGGDFKTIIKQIEKFYLQVLVLKEEIQLVSDK